MANEYLRLNDTQLNIEKAANLLAIVEDKRKNSDFSKDLKSENSVFAQLFTAFKDFFSKLGQPTIQKRFFKKESPARSADYNQTMQELHDDINVAYAETDSLSSVVVKDFNYSEIDRQMLLNKIRKLSSQAIDYSFYSEGAKSRSLFAIDDFVDNTKIDLSRVSPGVSPVELVTSEGLVTLKRTGNIGRNSLVEKVTGIKESIAEWNPLTETGGYEGLYFGMKNEARPEGGRWHITYTPDGTRLFENGAPEDEKMSKRLQMFDNNPDTFWEVELISNPVIGYRDKYTGKQLTVSEFNELIANEVNSPNVQSSAGGTIITSEHGSLIENYIPVTGTGGAQYLTCSFIAYLSKSENVNWVSLNPNNFGQELYMEVLSIQTSADGQTFSELEGFDDYEYETTLTRQANSELTPQEVRDTLSPDQFKYAGQGVWVFSPRLTKAIKFDLRQTRSYLKQYEVLMVEIEQTVTTTTTTSRFWGLSKKTSTESSTIQRQVEVPYLTGQVVGFDVMSLEPGSTDIGGKDNTGTAAVIGGVTGAGAGALIGMQIGSIGGPLGAGIGAVLGFVIGGLFGSSKSTETSVSPQRMTKQWTKLKDDKARFAIGIRDINIYSYKFAAVSELVSKSYSSPAPISKVSLTVEEQVPKIFYTSSSGEKTNNDWIKYYVSVDNGTSWLRISPIQHRATISEDGINNLPEIINFNSEVPSSERSNPLAYIDTASPVYEIRFKAVLSRPTDIEDAESYTPVLMKYALQIYPLGGL